MKPKSSKRKLVFAKVTAERNIDMPTSMPNAELQKPRGKRQICVPELELFSQFLLYVRSRMRVIQCHLRPFVGIGSLLAVAASITIGLLSAVPQLGLPALLLLQRRLLLHRLLLRLRLWCPVQSGPPSLKLSDASYANLS